MSLNSMKIHLCPFESWLAEHRQDAVTEKRRQIFRARHLDPV